MGLSQLMERPRNWGIVRDAMNDTIGIADNGRFFHMGTGTVSTSLQARQMIYPYDIVIHRFWMKIRAVNNLDPGSINTGTLTINRVNTANFITITDTTPDDTIIEVNGFTAPVAAGVEIGWIWNSDSTGTCVIAELGMAYRIVNPAV